MASLHTDSKTALATIGDQASAKGRIVFVSGNFNIVHPGHLRLLRFARECGDFLVVGVLDNRSDGATLDEALRLEGIQSNSWVDYAFVLRDPPEAFISALHPAVVVKGKEHENRFNAELSAIAEYGGSLLFCSGDVTFSSLDLLREEFQRTHVSAIVKPVDFPKRHGFSLSTLEEVLERIAGLRVLVIGDIIVDEYISCDPMGMSQEDPTIVVSPILSERFVGGAGIVAAHARGLGADTNLFTITGTDDAADFVAQRLAGHNVRCHLYRDPSRPTTLKQRYRAMEKTLLRVNHLRHHGINRSLQEQIRGDVRALLEDTDLLIFADFNYGCLPQPLVDDIVAMCRDRGVLTVADSQSSSQIGDVSRFQGMALLTPTEREARLALKDYSAGLVVLAENLRQQARARNIIMTLGKEGLLVHAEISSANQWLTDRLSAMNNAPKDPAGAGDSLLTCASLALAADSGIWQSAYLGSLAAACQVGRLGNVPVTADDIRRELQNRRALTGGEAEP